MIITISLYRVSDGLPVSASTEFSQDKALIDCRRVMKGIAQRLGFLYYYSNLTLNFNRPEISGLNIENIHF